MTPEQRILELLCDIADGRRVPEEVIREIVALMGSAEEAARREEREACARIAKNYRGKTCDAYNPIPKEIEAAIRAASPQAPDAPKEE